jgi:multidrug resistance efflux pump
MSGKRVLFGAAAILLVIAGGALLRHRRPAPGPPPKPSTTQATLPPGAEISLQARVEARQTVSVPVPIVGTIEAMPVEVGASVYQGQVLAEIKSEQLQAELETATADRQRIEDRVTELESDIIAQRLEVSRAHADAARARTALDDAEKAYQRQQVLYQAGATPRLVYEKSQRDYNTAKDDFSSRDALSKQAGDRLESLTGELDADQRELEDKTDALQGAQNDVAAGEVRAPVDGLLVGRAAGPGDSVNPSMQALFQIAVNLSAMQAIAQADAAVSNRIKAGQSAAIFIAEVPSGEIVGTVREVSNGLVIVDFTSPTPAIRPGVTARVRIKLT